MKTTKKEIYNEVEAAIAYRKKWIELVETDGDAKQAKRYLSYYNNAINMIDIHVDNYVRGV